MPQRHADRLLATDRRRRLADGAVVLLAEQGVHGLTHRRLDRALGLPEGSTANAFPTRDGLLAAALEALADADLETARRAAERSNAPLDPEEAAALFAESVLAWLKPRARARLRARYELFLEATRNPGLKDAFVERRLSFVRLAHGIAQRTGSSDPDGAASALVAWADGVLLANVADDARPPSRDQVTAVAYAILVGQHAEQRGAPVPEARRGPRDAQDRRRGG